MRSDARPTESSRPRSIWSDYLRLSPSLLMVETGGSTTQPLPSAQRPGGNAGALPPNAHSVKIDQIRSGAAQVTGGIPPNGKTLKAEKLATCLHTPSRGGTRVVATMPTAVRAASDVGREQCQPGRRPRLHSETI
jgi:hypothetical protein